jgi:selenocysteine-specific elongation factor
MAEAPTLTVGTAGHIDHGKTALVAALTGTCTDRLPEERRRGMSIELGFAELPLAGCRLSFIDVPGHHRFVRTMIAGASGIDLALLVVAADDGVMPQTLEHLVVLDALGVQDGVVAVTKCDLASAEARARAVDEVRQLRPDVPVVEVSVRSGEGLERLRATLEQVARAAVGRVRPPAHGRAVLHLDRVFTTPGHGTVATGTLWGGPIEVGARLRVLPRGREARVRGLEVHGRGVALAAPLQRVAVNLAGVGRDELTSGDVLADERAPVVPTWRLDVELLGESTALDEPLRLRVHLGTRAATARLVPLGDGLAQLRLETQLVAGGSDRLVLRRLQPPETIGGARVVDPAPRRHSPNATVRARLRLIERGAPRELLAAALAEAGTIPDRVELLHELPLLAAALHRIPPGEWEAALAELAADLRVRRKGTTLTLAEEAPRPPPAPTPAPNHPLAAPLLAAVRDSGLTPPTPVVLAARLGEHERAVRAGLDALTRAGELVRLKPDVHLDCGVFADARARIVALLEVEGALTIATLRDALGISRKYAQALLEQLDAERVTLRVGDEHRLRRRARIPGSA